MSEESFPEAIENGQLSDNKVTNGFKFYTDAQVLFFMIDALQKRTILSGTSVTTDLQKKKKEKKLHYFKKCTL